MKLAIESDIRETFYRVTCTVRVHIGDVSLVFETEGTTEVGAQRRAEQTFERIVEAIAKHMPEVLR